MNLITLINVKMPTIVGILTFISMINTTSESLKAREVYTFQLISFHELLIFHAQFYNIKAKSALPCPAEFGCNLLKIMYGAVR